ncbi:MAG: MFS transporter [Bauldia litoralis]
MSAPGSDMGLRGEARWLASGFLLMFGSGFGQTYFIALFVGHLKIDLGLSDGLFGSLYMAGTIASAALLMWAGKFVDRWPVRWFGVGVMAGLAAMALAMASVSSAWMLAFVLFGLRFFGQGMMTHTAMTAMGRWFNRKRGRAVSIAGLGLPASEGVMPLVAVAAIGLIGWRATWLAGAALVALVGFPILIVLLRRERTPTSGPASSGPAGPEDQTRHWTRGEVLRSPLFYALLPGLMAPPFILTGIFISQVAIVEMKGWQLSWFAASFTVMAGVHVVAALISGWLIDRFGARRLLPVVLLPLSAATFLLTVVDSAWVLIVFMVLVGFVVGGISTVSGALWAELYGTRHLGAIRAPVTAAMVFSTALAPGLIGVLLDAGVGLDIQLIGMTVYCVAAAVWMVVLMPRLNRMAVA